MEIIRLNDLPKTQAGKIRARQRRGTMTIVVDEENYVCFIKKEYDEWKPKRAGRKPAITSEGIKYEWGD